ncbi:MAG: hypothetical protein SCG84_02185 [Nitrosomonadaceae bacterium]|nr:hypothetical protein [Nitrosomonadaceae bacterium]MDW7667036.1 hypothetical protein [Nitrosomonadaceae bacterium]
MNKIAALLMIFALTGCATTGGGGFYSPVVDPSQANSIEYAQALKDCNAIESANTSLAGSTATGAVGGAAIGAGLGAIVGAILGVDVGSLAGAAAAVGGVRGALDGASGSLNKSQTIVRNCLVSKGFKVYY